MRALKIKWLGFPAAYYGANAVWQGYMSLYYAHAGLGSGQIGLVGAAMSLCALLVQPLWGMLGDRTAQTGRLLSLLALLSALSLPLALFFRGFEPQLLCAALFYSFYCALLPMGDALLLQGLKREGRPFGPYRLAGAISFAICGAVFGGIIEKTGARAVIFATSALLLPAALFALLLPRPEKRDPRKIAFGALLKDRDLLRLLAFMIPVQATMGYFYTFFAPHFSGLKGASGGLLGLGYGLATLSEIPYLLLCDRIFAKYGAARPMCISAVVLMLRWLLLGLSKNAALSIACQLLHGGGFIVMTVSMARYIAAHVDENLQASGQMLLNMASFGIARVAGSMGGGFLAEKLGSANVFLIGSGVCFAAVCLFAAYAFRRRS